MYGSPPGAAASKDLNLPFSPSPAFDHQEESDLRRNPPQMSSGLLRYRSAPSALFGDVCDDFLPAATTAASPETVFARFLGPDNRDKPPVSGEGQRGNYVSAAPPASMEMLYQSQAQQQLMPSHSSVESLCRTVSSTSTMEVEQSKGGGDGNCNNLIRQNSYPAGFFSNLNAENGYGVARGIGRFRDGNGSMGDASSRSKGQISFSSRQNSGFMSQMSDISIPEDGYPMGSWEDSSTLLSDNFSALKRARDGDGKTVAGLHPSESQNGEMKNHALGLSHQLSLPKSSSEMAAYEKFLQFQDAVPCRIRAKRGCATHPRSIAERMRRTRISERMRKLQDLVPNMDKQTNTADMLELAVEHIKDLQRQVNALTERRGSCSCSASKQKP
ncbi:transcription factor bHLH130-like [Typha latifolia]|uniref:transcription factor bHLH130-like n=1 Tax=Typha latifolia TaxID=4733 RepID=UPI003C2D91AD